MSQDSRHRVAIVGGTGMWGQRYLREACRRDDVEAILVDTSDRLDEFARHYGVAESYESLDRLLERDAPDLVCNIVPVGVAVELVTRCAEAGVRVISCEKPIAVDLETADQMVAPCREHGAAFGCGTAYFEIPYFVQAIEWIDAGNIGEITAAAIPGGLPREVSGGGCVQLTHLRAATGREAEWVEGWTLPPTDGYRAPEADEVTLDCPAYGRIGLSGGLVCEVPEPLSDKGVGCRVSITGENGQVFLQAPRPVFIVGTGARATPVYPEFLDEEPVEFMTGRLQSLIDSLESGGPEAVCSGHDYRQALELAVGFKLSAAAGNRRIDLPLADRAHRIYPHPYRQRGGDAVGYDTIGYAGPPRARSR